MGLLWGTKTRRSNWVPYETHISFEMSIKQQVRSPLFRFKFRVHLKVQGFGFKLKNQAKAPAVRYDFARNIPPNYFFFLDSQSLFSSQEIEPLQSGDVIARHWWMFLWPSEGPVVVGVLAWSTLPLFSNQGTLIVCTPFLMSQEMIAWVFDMSSLSNSTSFPKPTALCSSRHVRPINRVGRHDLVEYITCPYKLRKL